MRLNLKSVEERVKPLANRTSYDREFIFELLAAYGRSAGNITRLRNGSLNIADDPTTEVGQKNVVYFKSTTEDLYGVIDELRTSPTVVRYSCRFVIVTDFKDLLAVDTKTNETLAAPITDIDKHFTFFLPWAGMEKAQYVGEAHADVKAAERMAKLFDELVAINPGIHGSPQARHALNVFFTRLLFCFFAEDTGIFKSGQFTEAVSNLTQPDGSDVDQLLTDLFTALDTPDGSPKPAHLAAFPYVNGRLFTVEAHHTVPKFNKKARDLLIESGRLLWSEINPDIFGSMFQAVVTPGQRSDLGQHYTSVPNILKTIEPLFLDDLKEQLNAGFGSMTKLEALLTRISKIKIFDPACGSGNFLVIAYKELRKLEHAILERLQDLRTDRQHAMFVGSQINIENFFGIELDDFAVEVAILSLWIAKHQMNVEFFDKFGIDLPLIPLKEAGRVRQGNATRVDWQQVCPNSGNEEIYLIGNPPYAGGKVQTKEQKTDYSYVFGTRPYSKNLNYISLWFIKGADYIKGTRAEIAFVTTNSISQGEHVGLLFPTLFGMGLEIGYAYTSFKWENNARRNAGVTVAVVNLRNARAGVKYLYSNELRIEADNINGYLADGPFVLIERRKSPIGCGGELPSMVFGSMPRDGGGLILTPEEKERLVAEAPDAEAFVKAYVGSDEFIKGLTRYCLWIDDRDLARARSIKPIVQRLELVSASRSASKAPSTVAFAEKPHRFVQISYKPTESIIIPSISSERRDYIPIGYLDADTVVSNKAFALYNAEPWVFSLLTSRMHMTWTRAVTGRHEMRYQYSNTIVYNNFPVPRLTSSTKAEMNELALRVLDVREYHSEKTLADLYDPDLMPDDLRLAHQELDQAVDVIYRKRGFDSDEDRLSFLFGMYEQTANAEAKK
ncbi:class I SAM-dependent DNA methyltransferase [Rhodococcus ruber]|uniref:class I SAM-dependent DNA methyltransferase n=1 Tax=Rhodococcus ruber TaxID=1830 RepID=UPI0017860455|nr:class I SAM-dependent DNA methyltransferase [Rhodococcus ruber]MBD8057152.1 class I SAM-dependent DNA methyltransferase [Rhodococcus ruber]